MASAARPRACARVAGALAVALLAGLPAACVTRSASVGHRMLLPGTGARYEPGPTGLFVMPLVLSSPEPEFPAAAGPVGSIEKTVCAEVWLSADGEITRVAPFDQSSECAEGGDAQAQPYAASVAAALRHWEFTPAMVCEFPPDQPDRRAQGDCTGPDVTVRRVPVRLNYAFTFSSRNGRRRVGFARASVDGSHARP